MRGDSNVRPRDLGAPGHDSRYGWGLVDATTATTPLSALTPSG